MNWLRENISLDVCAQRNSATPGPPGCPMPMALESQENDLADSLTMDDLTSDRSTCRYEIALVRFRGPLALRGRHRLVWRPRASIARRPERPLRHGFGGRRPSVRQAWR